MVIGKYLTVVSLGLAIFYKHFLDSGLYIDQAN